MATSEITDLFKTETPALLVYRFSTDPEPMQSGTINTPATARINLSVFPGKDLAYCNKIKIAVPIGKTGSDLSEKTPLASVNTDKWNIESTLVKKGSELGLESSTNYAVFVFSTRDKADNKISYSLIFGLTVVVNEVPGQFIYSIQETSGTSPEVSSFKARSAQFPLGKFAPEFYLKNFIAAAKSTPTVPCSEFPNGADIRLSWESNGTWFQLFRKNETKAVWEGNETSHLISPGPGTNTTFILCATGGTDFHPIRLYDTLSITISNPDLSAKTLNVEGATKLHDTRLEGTFDATGATKLRSTILEGTLDVTGVTKLRETKVEGNLTISGKTEISDVEFKKSPNITSARIANLSTDTVSIYKDASLKGNTSVNNLTVSGTFSIPGKASIIQSGSNDWIRPGTYTADTDMLIIANISGGGKSDDPSFGTVKIITAGRTISASGGHISGPWAHTYNMNGSVTAFVKKGESYELGYEAASGGPNYCFYRWSIGQP